MQKYAKAMHTRVSFISGDVHCAAVGMLKTFVKEKKKGDIPPGLDYRYMLNIVSSMSRFILDQAYFLTRCSTGAIVNTP